MIARNAAAAVAVIAAAASLPSPALAGPLAEALARGDDEAIAALRARPDDAAARCTLGAIYAKRRDLTRAWLYLAGCADRDLPEDIAGPVAKIAGDTRRTLDASDLASIEVMSPAGLRAESTALPGEPFTVPATLWVAPGSYEVSTVVNGRKIGRVVQAEARKRSPVVLEVPAEKAPADPRDQRVSFDDQALEDQETAPPPAVKHASIVPTKYRRGMAQRDPLAAGAVEPDDDEAGRREQLVDPLATRAAAPRPPRAHWLGVRAGGGMFDDGRAAARAGVAIAVTGRFAVPALARGAFLAGRLDWARRGGAPAGAPGGSMIEAVGAIDAIGAAAGAGLTVLQRGGIALAVIAQLRGELRLAASRAELTVPRAGLGAAAGLELALPATPFTAGLRFEHGLTELVDGARDRAALIELGIDWR